MKYADIRDHIQTGDALVFSTRTWNGVWDWLAHVVRFVGQTEYSHIGFAWVEHGRVWVVEATRHGVYPMLLSEKMEAFYWIRHTRMSDDALTRAFSMVGRRYGWLDAALAGLRRLKVGSNRVWQCAEYFVWAKEIDGVNPTPADVVDHLLGEGFSLTKVKP